MNAVMLIAHGTVERLDDLPRFLANIRHGRAPGLTPQAGAPVPDDVAREVRRRYEAIGGKSPLLDVTRRLAEKVERALGVPTQMAMRLWEPYPKGVLAELAARGVTRVAVVPLAQHSAAVYARAVEAAADALHADGGPRVALAAAPNWGRTPRLVEAYAARVRDAIARVPASARGTTRVVMTAHSLPASVAKMGDPYESEVRAAAELVAARLGDGAPPHVLAFQSQGMTGPAVEWLGPDLVATLDRARADGVTHVVVAPLGFLADHVEILYDLDIEARAWAKERGIELSRSESLNDADDLVAAVADVARPLLAEAAR